MYEPNLPWKLEKRTDTDRDTYIIIVDSKDDEVIDAYPDGGDTWDVEARVNLLPEVAEFICKAVNRYEELTNIVKGFQLGPFDDPQFTKHVSDETIERLTS